MEIEFEVTILEDINLTLQYPTDFQCTTILMEEVSGTLSVKNFTSPP